MLSDKHQQAIHWSTNRKGGWSLLSDELCNKTGQPDAEVIWEKHMYMRVTPVENTACAAFEEYEDIPERLPLVFTEDDVT